MFEQIKNKRNELRGKTDVESVVTYNLLTLVIGEVELQQKRKQVADFDAEAVTVMKKLFNSNTETMKRTQLEAVVSKLMMENNIMKQFLPEEKPKMSVADIEVALSKFVYTSIKEVVQHFKENYDPETYDNKTVVEVAKGML